MMYISKHMWTDESSAPQGWFMPKPYNECNCTDVAVWDETVKYISDNKFNLLLLDVGDGIKYESHPEISAPDAWDKDFLKKKLDEIRALGITPIPKLNFSTGHDTWLKGYRRMISTTEYYRVCTDLIGEVCEAFEYPELFHLGFDEEEVKHQREFEMCIERGRELWWHDLNLFANECMRHGVRPWMWSDYMWQHTEEYLNRMSKDIVQSNWYYGPFKDSTYAPGTSSRICIESYELLDKHGFDQIPCCSCWANNLNVRQTIGYCKNKLNEEHLMGIMVAPWLHTVRENSYDLLANAQRFYFGRKEHYPETL